MEQNTVEEVIEDLRAGKLMYVLTIPTGKTRAI